MDSATIIPIAKEAYSTVKKRRSGLAKSIFASPKVKQIRPVSFTDTSPHQA